MKEVDSVTIKYKATKIGFSNAPLILQQYRWNRWITTDSIGCKNQRELILKVHPGTNMFRIKLTNSKIVLCKFQVQGPIQESFSHHNELRKKTFNRVVLWEIYDSEGNLVKSGESKVVYFDDLKKGFYYLNYDDVHSEFSVRGN